MNDILKKLQTISDTLDKKKDIELYDYAIIQMNLYLYKIELQKFLLAQLENKMNEAEKSDYSGKPGETIDEKRERLARIKKRLGVLAVRRREMQLQYDKFESLINDISAKALMDVTEKEKKDIDNVINEYEGSIV